MGRAIPEQVINIKQTERPEKARSTQCRHGLCFSSCLRGPALAFLGDGLHRKPNKPFPPRAAFGCGVHPSRKNQTRTLSDSVSGTADWPHLRELPRAVLQGSLAQWNHGWNDLIPETHQQKNHPCDSSCSGGHGLCMAPSWCSGCPQLWLVPRCDSTHHCRSNSGSPLPQTD